MTAMHRMCRAFLPGVLQRGGGSIINGNVKNLGY